MTRKKSMVFLALVLVTVLSTGISLTPTWAGPAQTTEAEITPFSFELLQPPTAAALVKAETFVRVTGAGDWFDLTSTGFEGTFLPAGWEVQGENVWVKSDTESSIGTYSAAAESFAGTPITWLIYGGASGFSLQDWTNARLNFDYWLDTGADTFLGWAASADGTTFHGAQTSGRVQSWLAGSLDLGHLVGDDSVWIAFAISGDGSGTGQNIFLDEVAIEVQEPYFTYLPAIMNNYASPSWDFIDNFDDPSSGWPVEHVENAPAYEVHRDYLDGKYWMKLNYIWFHRIFASPAGVMASGDYTLQTDLMYDFGDYRAEWGVVFEANDDMTSYYMVALYPYGDSGPPDYEPTLQFRIRRRTPSGEEDLANEGAPWFLQTNSWQWTTIRIVREGNQIRFYAYIPYPWAEWSLVKAVEAPPLSGERVGFHVFSSELGAEAYFDNFRLWQEPRDP